LVLSLINQSSDVNRRDGQVVGVIYDVGYILIPTTLGPKSDSKFDGCSARNGSRSLVSRKSVGYA